MDSTKFEYVRYALKSSLSQGKKAKIWLEQHIQQYPSICQNNSLTESLSQ